MVIGNIKKIFSAEEKKRERGRGGENKERKWIKTRECGERGGGKQGWWRKGLKRGKGKQEERKKGRNKQKENNGQLKV